MDRHSSSADSTRVLIADDHAIVRAALRALLETEPDVVVVGEAGDGDEAIQLATTLRPDVVLIDLLMPNADGITAVARLRERCPGTKILVVSAIDDGMHVRQALLAGAAGYLPKRAVGAELRRAVRLVGQGHHYLSPDLTTALVTQPSSAAPDPRVLSERQNEAMRLVALGYTLKEVAAHLRISVKTAETYKARAMQKLGLTTRVDLIRYALQNGWLHEDAPTQFPASGDPAPEPRAGPPPEAKSAYGLKRRG